MFITSWNSGPASTRCLVSPLESSESTGDRHPPRPVEELELPELGPVARKSA